MNANPQKTETNKSDNELVTLTLENKDNFSYLIERYEKKLYRYIWRLTGLSKECCEDILQETFIKIYRNINNFDQRLKFSSWAYRITHNEALNYVRKYKGEKTVGLESDDSDVNIELLQIAFPIIILLIIIIILYLLTQRTSRSKKED